MAYKFENHRTCMSKMILIKLVILLSYFMHHVNPALVVCSTGHPWVLVCDFRPSWGLDVLGSIDCFSVSMRAFTALRSYPQLDFLPPIWVPYSIRNAAHFSVGFSKLRNYYFKTQFDSIYCFKPDLTWFFILKAESTLVSILSILIVCQLPYLHIHILGN